MGEAETQSSPPARRPIPEWVREVTSIYESGSASQFILYGNIYDLFLPPSGHELVPLVEFIETVLLSRFDVVLSYDLGSGVRVEKGSETFSTWPTLRGNPELPRAPLQAVDSLTHYFRYCANLANIDSPEQASKKATHVACIIQDAHLLASAERMGGYDANALVLLLRSWSSENLLLKHPLVTFLACENLNDLSPLLVNNPRVARIKIPLPNPDELTAALSEIAPRYPTALGEYRDRLQVPAGQLCGAQLGTIESLLKRKEHEKSALRDTDLVALKKKLVESDCNGLIEFVESKKSLDDLYGQDEVKKWLRQDIALWKAGELAALPMGYLLCGPVGTGKTYMVECLAGEASAPVVKIKNFRDRWVGSSEGNLEKIFRLLHALGRCIVFIDEADQALGKRESGTGDSGLSGRIYAMVAEEMSKPANRGSIIWVLASSRPDLIEVDLKRPGRVDVKIPLFPTASAEESMWLIGALLKKRGIGIVDDDLKSFGKKIPTLLTPGAAEALVSKIYRISRAEKVEPREALRRCLEDYQPPVDPEILRFQISIAIREATDPSFIPQAFRDSKPAAQ